MHNCCHVCFDLESKCEGGNKLTVARNVPIIGTHLWKGYARIMTTDDESGQNTYEQALQCFCNDICTCNTVW